MRFPVPKSYVPRSLYARATLILIVPLLALQLVVSIVFIQRHFEGVTRQMTRNIARELAVAQQVIDTSPSTEIAQLRLSNLSRPLEISLALDAEGMPDPWSRRIWYDLSGRALIHEMEALLGKDLSIDLASNTKIVDARLQTDKGLLHAVIPRSRVTASNPHQLLVLTALTALLLAAVALLFLRNQMRPIHRLAEAAEAFGKGRSVPYRIAGADEVRRAGTAFLAMRSRLERQIEQRTQMLSGVSHDLRTPLTRMKLTLELLDEDTEIAAMKRDVSDMEEMLNAFLAFARGDQLEDMREVDLVTLLDDLAANNARSGIKLNIVRQIDTPDNTKVTLRETAVCRALQNLINNGARYGTHVRLTLRLSERMAVFEVEDDGPGIAPEDRETVLRPFARLDEARNQDKGGGVGLGLSITQDVARSHGGSLELGDSADMGGLRSTFRLPR